MKAYIEKIYNKSKKEFYENIEQKIQKEQKEFIITANPEILMIGEKDEEFNKILMDPETRNSSRWNRSNKRSKNIRN